MKDKGFTLVEILLAFTIFLLLILLIFTGFRLSSRTTEKITERDETSQRIRVVYERLGWLIRGAYPYKFVDKDGKERLLFTGEGNSIGFVTTSVIPATGKIYDLSGLKWVYLFVDNEGLKEKDNVFFLEKNLEESREGAFILDPSVKSMNIEYLDPEENTWVDTWGPDNERLPPAIKIRLNIMGHETQEMILSIPASGG